MSELGPTICGMASNPTPQTWAASLLKRLGIHQTPGAVQALTGWARAEGGHWNNDARFNPLNTTQPEPGAGNTGSQGNIKVYKSWGQGLDATVATLRNGRYGGILSALKAGDPGRVASAIGSSPWGTSASTARSAILGTPRVAGVQAFAGGGSSAGGGSTTTTTTAGAPGAPDLGAGSTAATDLVSSLLAARQQAPASVSAPAAPSFSAQAVLPQGYVAPSGGSPQAPPDVSALLAAVRTAGVGPPQDAGQTTSATTSSVGGSGGLSSAGGQVSVSPTANRAGAGLTPGIQKVLRAVAGVAGPITVGTGTNHNRLTVDGNVSDHYSGNAADLPTSPGARNIQLGRQALIAAGMPRAQAEKATGGIYNIPYGSHRRIQVIFNTNEGGNHHNHVHVGVTGLSRR